MIPVGINVEISLPPNVRVDDVAGVIGKAAGLGIEVGSEFVGWNPHEIKIVSMSTPQLAEIQLQGRMVDTMKNRYIHYHFEGTGGRRVLMPPSTPFWCAIGETLVQFFGGRLRFRGGAAKPDLVVRGKINKLNCPTTDADYENLCQRIRNVCPVKPNGYNSVAGRRK